VEAHNIVIELHMRDGKRLHLHCRQFVVTHLSNLEAAMRL
jgi:hypothetical protein